MCAKSDLQLMTLLMMIVVLCIVSTAQAQPQSDNYILKKWAISSGGGSMNSVIDRPSSSSVRAVHLASLQALTTPYTAGIYSLYLGESQDLLWFGFGPTALMSIWTGKTFPMPILITSTDLPILHLSRVQRI